MMLLFVIAVFVIGGGVGDMTSTKTITRAELQRIDYSCPGETFVEAEIQRSSIIVRCTDTLSVRFERQ